MCGFAGLLRWSSLSPDDPQRVRQAADVLAHRGPDSSGAWHDSHIALGFRRLKIIDLSSHGEQPMANEDGSLQVVFNGEIYNYRALRSQLKKQGHVFKSDSDTEVLVHLYEQHGKQMLPLLRGMFAFAIWDSKERRLFLARDPLGVKPLYFAERDGFIAFASEPKALFALGVKADMDPVAVHEALTYRYVPAPRSGFRDVEKLPPGHWAQAKDEALTFSRWWDVPSNVDAQMSNRQFDAERRRTIANLPRGMHVSFSHVTFEENLFGQLGEHLDTGVKRRLVSDVSLGAWLSGGIDSGLVASKFNQQFSTFCAGFGTAEYDERELARATSQKLGTRHSDFEIPPDVFRLLPQIVWHADEPFFDSSCLPTFVLAEKTKPHATVVLSGDGGDEAFAGYDRYVGMKMLRLYKRVPGLFRKLALSVAPKGHSRQGWDRMLRWLEKCRAMEASGHHPYVAAMELFTEEQKQGLYGERMRDATDGCDAREVLEQTLLRIFQSMEASGAKPERSSVGVLQRADLVTYLPGDVLHKVDRMSMAHGVEVRSPFLDVDLVEWALRLPDETRLPGRTTKPLLRELAKRVLPPEVVNARKRGFGVPLDDWFRGDLQKIALGIFEESHLVSEGVLAPRFWETLWREHQERRAQHGERLYALLSLELWHRTFLSGAVPTSRPSPL